MITPIVLANTSNWHITLHNLKVYYLLIWYTYILYNDYPHSVIANTSITSHNYSFFLVGRTFKTYSLCDLSLCFDPLPRLSSSLVSQALAPKFLLLIQFALHLYLLPLTMPHSETHQGIFLTPTSKNKKALKILSRLLWIKSMLPLWYKNNCRGASLVAQWLRVCLPVQGTRVQALVWEDPTCRGATRPVSHNYWACASGACAPQQERPR